MPNTTHTKNGRIMAEHAKEAAGRVAASAGDMASGAAKHYVQEPASDLFSLGKAWAKDNPDVAMCWAFGLGVLFGWKLKP